MDKPAGEASAEDGAPAERGAAGSQTLVRGLDIIEAVMEQSLLLPELALKLGLTRSTAYRLANVLVERRFLSLVPRHGYRLGPKLIELGFLAQSQVDLVQTARPHLEALSMRSEDTVHLGIDESERALYLDKIPGRRRVEIGSRVGERQPLTSTGLGKALLLDSSDERWRRAFDLEQAEPRTAWPLWLERMRGYAEAGRAYDLEENEDQIRCVAAPVRDARGRIIAAISLSSAAQYMDDQRMTTLSDEVCDTARAISRDLGWTDESGDRHRRARSG